jgi:hypothetical protein
MFSELYDQMGHIDHPAVLVLVAGLAVFMGMATAALHQEPALLVGLRAFLVLVLAEIASGVGLIISDGLPFGLAHIAYCVLWAAWSAAYAVGVATQRGWRRAHIR